MSKQWGIRPSEFCGITDPLIAYWFDRSVMYFGNSYEADIEDATKDAKNRSQAERAARVVSDRWIRDDDAAPQEEIKAPNRFRDPAEVFAEMKRRKGE